jgi:hypothetical protein
MVYEDPGERRRFYVYRFSASIHIYQLRSIRFFETLEVPRGFLLIKLSRRGLDTACSALNF